MMIRETGFVMPAVTDPVFHFEEGFDVTYLCFRKIKKITISKVEYCIFHLITVEEDFEMEFPAYTDDVYLRLDELPEQRPIGKWGRMHLRYIRENRPSLYLEITLSGRMKTYLADVNEQVQARLECIIAQMKAQECVTEDLKCQSGGVGCSAWEASKIAQKRLLWLRLFIHDFAVIRKHIRMKHKSA